jgi:UDP-3-O-[3-hydroxymyristoyl] glucosamine N-acyltransferase
MKNANFSMYSIRQLTQHLGAQSEGNEGIQITAINSLAKAKPGEISYFKEAKFEKYLYDTKASAILVPVDFKPKKPLKATLLRVADVMQSYMDLLYLFQPNDIFERGNPEHIEIADSAEIGRTYGWEILHRFLKEPLSGREARSLLMFLSVKMFIWEKRS